jgi:GTP-binding protein
MFVDEITITAKAGNGGDGVVRWHREKFKPKGGPAGGNGGRGGDVYARAVRDLNQLAKYTGLKHFAAADGADGQSRSQHGKGSPDLYIDVPVGSRITDEERDRQVELTAAGETVKILHGGQGGLGNEYFKSSTNRAPQEATAGKPGETGTFRIELSLIADVGLVGLPNAGKSTLLNTFTNASSAVGSYPFTTTSPHLGALYEFVLADIPGLIAGASAGKGLGHRFLRHVSRTHMLLHLVSLDSEDPVADYYTIQKELADYEKSLTEKEQWIIFTKKDLVKQDKIDTMLHSIDETKNRVFVVSAKTGEGVKELQDALVQHLRQQATEG